MRTCKQLRKSKINVQSLWFTSLRGANFVLSVVKKLSVYLRAISFLKHKLNDTYTIF